jgi:hypothetical protein
MILNPQHKYLLLDGMPYVKTPDKGNFVFAITTKRWEPVGNDDFDAVYPNWETWWDDKFAKLPELPGTQEA